MLQAVSALCCRLPTSYEHVATDDLLLAGYISASTNAMRIACGSPWSKYFHSWSGLGPSHL